jgi:hypothetical protein
MVAGKSPRRRRISGYWWNFIELMSLRSVGECLQNRERFDRMLPLNRVLQVLLPNKVSIAGCWLNVASGRYRSRFCKRLVA